MNFKQNIGALRYDVNFVYVKNGILEKVTRRLKVTQRRYGLVKKPKFREQYPGVGDRKKAKRATAERGMK